MTVKIFTLASVPDELAQAWLQHLRDFDTAHPGCHFEVFADALDMSLHDMVATLMVEPELTFNELILRRQRKPS